MYQFFQKDAEVDAVGVHRHIDTGINGNANSVFLVFGNMLALEKIVDVGPVSDEHAIPVQVFFQPFSQVFIAGMYRYAVDGG